MSQKHATCTIKIRWFSCHKSLSFEEGCADFWEPLYDTVASVYIHRPIVCNLQYYIGVKCEFQTHCPVMPWENLFFHIHRDLQWGTSSTHAHSVIHVALILINIKYLMTLLLIRRDTHCASLQEMVVPDKGPCLGENMGASEIDIMHGANTSNNQCCILSMPFWVFFYNKGNQHVLKKGLQYCVSLQSDCCLPSRDHNDARQHWLVAR